MFFVGYFPKPYRGPSANRKKENLQANPVKTNSNAKTK